MQELEIISAVFFYFGDCQHTIFAKFTFRSTFDDMTFLRHRFKGTLLLGLVSSNDFNQRKLNRLLFQKKGFQHGNT